jgi:hypothetical protein
MIVVVALSRQPVSFGLAGFGRMWPAWLVALGDITMTAIDSTTVQNTFQSKETLQPIYETLG